MKRYVSTLFAFALTCGCSQHSDSNRTTGAAAPGALPSDAPKALPGAAPWSGKVLKGSSVDSLRAYLQNVREVKATRFEVQWNPATVAIDRETAIRSLRRVSRDGATFTFAASEPVLAQVKPGSILWVRDLAVRKVDAVSTENGFTQVHTQSVSLTEAIPNAIIEFEAAVPVQNFLLSRPDILPPLKSARMQPVHRGGFVPVLYNEPGVRARISPSRSAAMPVGSGAPSSSLSRSPGSGTGSSQASGPSSSAPVNTAPGGNPGNVPGGNPCAPGGTTPSAGGPGGSGGVPSGTSGSSPSGGPTPSVGSTSGPTPSAGPGGSPGSGGPVGSGSGGPGNSGSGGPGNSGSGGPGNSGSGGPGNSGSGGTVRSWQGGSSSGTQNGSSSSGAGYNPCSRPSKNRSTSGPAGSAGKSTASGGGTVKAPGSLGSGGVQGGGPGFEPGSGPAAGPGSGTGSAPTSPGGSNPGGSLSAGASNSGGSANTPASPGSGAGAQGSGPGTGANDGSGSGAANEPSAPGSGNGPPDNPSNSPDSSSPSSPGNAGGPSGEGPSNSLPQPAGSSAPPPNLPASASSPPVPPQDPSTSDDATADDQEDGSFHGNSYTGSLNGMDYSLGYSPSADGSLDLSLQSRFAVGGGSGSNLFAIIDDNLDIRFKVDAQLSGFGASGLYQVANGNLEQAQLQFKNLKGHVNAAFVGRLGQPGNKGVKIPIMHLPIAFNVPLPVEGIPFVLQIGADFLMTVFLSGNHASMAVNGEYDFDGTSGFSYAKAANQMSDSSSLSGNNPAITNYQGASLGASAVMLAVQLPRVGFGLGITGIGSTVAYFDVIHVYTMTQSADVAAGLGFRCKRVTYNATGHVGVATDIVPLPIEAVRQWASDKVNGKREVFNYMKEITDPQIKACEI